MVEFIERLRAKPEHQRRRIAFGATSAITGVVAIGWFAAVLASGTLTLSGQGTLAQNPTLGDAVAESNSGFGSLMAGAAAFTGATSSEPTLTIVEGDTSSTLESPRRSDTRTVIPF